MIRSLASLRSFCVAASLLAFAAPSASAQQAAAHDAHQGHGAKPVLSGELAEHFKGIELTEAQTRQVIEIQRRAHHAMDSLRRSGRDQNDPALKAEIKKLMDAEHTDFKALLTPAQLQVFEANMKAHHEAEASARPAAAATRPSTGGSRK